MDRVRGLDAIRAVCAFWVVMFHFSGLPAASIVGPSTSVGWFFRALNNNAWNGVAAVIVFFVVSGFCIHYPFARNLRIPSTPEFAARRYLRIGVPLVAAVLVSRFVGVTLDLFHDSILWSLAAELIYYSLYPALLSLRRRGITWGEMFAVSFLAALALAASNPLAGNYPSWGVWGNWILGLPCWLAGCELAERTARGRLPSPTNIWAWRLGVWALATGLSVLRHHTPIGYPWTLNVFAVVAAMWLAREIRYYQDRKPVRWLESAGRWSYSVYLIHLPAHAVFNQFLRTDLGDVANWLLQMAFILTASYAFYLVVERPAHLVARWIGRRKVREEVRPQLAPRIKVEAQLEPAMHA